MVLATSYHSALLRPVFLDLPPVLLLPNLAFHYKALLFLPLPELLFLHVLDELLLLLGLVNALLGFVFFDLQLFDTGFQLLKLQALLLFVGFSAKHELSCCVGV